MIKPIVRDRFFLKLQAADATKEDLSTAQNLVDTLNANLSCCVGLAANMIGVSKRIIAVSVGGIIQVMLNPVITKKYGIYETEEGCLSLDGIRRTTRYKTIEVEYFDCEFKKHSRIFHEFTAEIIQHEIDHCNGILI